MADDARRRAVLEEIVRRKRAAAAGQPITPVSSQPTTPAPPQEEWDKESEAPWDVRAAVMSAEDKNERLKRLQAFYGDSAREEDGGNYSFVDPETGKRTLFNKEGFSFGDVADYGRDIASGIAGLFGAGAGNIWAGAALGSLAASGTGQAFDSWMENRARTAAKERGQDMSTQNISDRAWDFAKDSLAGTVLGGAIGRGIQAGVKAFSPLKQEIVQAYKNINNKFPDINYQIPTISSATGNGRGATLENAASAMIGGGRIQDAVELSGKKNAEVIDSIASQLAGGQRIPQTVNEFGSALLDGLERAKAQNSLDFAKATQAIGSDTWGKLPALAEHTKAMVRDLLGDKTGDIRKTANTRITNPISDLLADAQPTKIPPKNLLHLMMQKAGVAPTEAPPVLNYEGLKEVRHRLGEILEQTPSQIAATYNTSASNVRRLYDAVRNDIHAAIPQQHLSAYLEAEKNYAEKADLGRKLQQMFVGRNGKNPDKVGGNALKPYNMNGTTTEWLESFLKPQDWNAIRAGVAKQIGAPAGGKGSVDEAFAGAILRDIGEGKRAYRPEAQQKLWGNAFDDLKTIAEGQDKARSLYNFSNTANQMQAWKQAMQTGKVLGGLLIGGASAVNPAVAAGGLLGIAAPNAFARLSTNPQWLAKPQSAWSKAITDKIVPYILMMRGVTY